MQTTPKQPLQYPPLKFNAQAPTLPLCIQGTAPARRVRTSWRDCVSCVSNRGFDTGRPDTDFRVHAEAACISLLAVCEPSMESGVTMSGAPSSPYRGLLRTVVGGAACGCLGEALECGTPREGMGGLGGVMGGFWGESPSCLISCAMEADCSHSLQNIQK